MKAPVLSGIGDVSQVTVPTPQVFFDNQPTMADSAGRPTTPEPGNFAETPAFTGNSGRLAEGQRTA